MSNEFLDYVEDMLDAIDKAELLVRDVTYDQFADDFALTSLWSGRLKSSATPPVSLLVPPPAAQTAAAPLASDHGRHSIPWPVRSAHRATARC